MDNSPFGTFADRVANGTANGQPMNQDAGAVSPNEEIQHIAGAIEELQGRLARANEKLSQVASIQTTEIEIGRLFVEAQRFSEASLARLEIQVQEIVLEAEAKAAEIVREATEEADEIRRQAQQAGRLPGHTAQELKSVIAAFASVNGELIKQINALNAMLTPLVDRRTASIGQPPAPMPGFSSQPQGHTAV
jgi:cell division septum initiation protein DivIVA